jgi:ankyrin repeat protein
LFDAVQGGHLHIVRLLVEAGARKDAVAEHDGSTPLCLAAELNRLDIVQFLLERGADKDHATHDGLTPLHFAAKNGHFRMVK